LFIVLEYISLERAKYRFKPYIVGPDMNKAAFALIIILAFLPLVVAGPPFIESTAAQNYITITIKTDGSIEGTDKIQRDRDTYLFNGSITGSIIVERDNIIVDGAGNILLAESDNVVGVDIRNRKNVTIVNLVITGFLGRCGILLVSSTDCNITRNKFNDNFIGIEMTGNSSRNKITENLIQNCGVGMEIYSVRPGSDNAILENEVANSSVGMQIKNFVNTCIVGNKIISNTFGLGLGVGSDSIAKNNMMINNTYGFRTFNVAAVNVDVDTSNTVNEKPIIYWVNEHDKTVPAGVCYVALIGCTGITVNSLDLGGNLEGVFLGSSTNSTITNNKLSECLFGINLDASSNNTISGNTITRNENGIQLRWSSLNNIIWGNDIAANTVTGVYLADSAENKILENNIANSERGVYTEYCGTNIIHHNNFVNNTKQWWDAGFTPWPIPLPISISVWDDGKEGNYWNDYNGTDANGDGIGDEPNILGTNNTDRYPLLKPAAIPEGPGDGETTKQPFPATYFFASVVAATSVGMGLFVLFRKRNRLKATLTRLRFWFCLSSNKDTV